MPSPRQDRDRQAFPLTECLLRFCIEFCVTICIINATYGVAASTPTISAISPSTVMAGQQVTISGTNLGSAGGYAVFGTIYDPYNVSWTNTQVIVTVPGMAQSGPLSILPAGGAQSNSLPLTIGGPTITSISPSTVTAGQQMTITGMNFGLTSGYAVFGSIYDPYNVSWTNTQIIVTVPGCAQSGPFSIETAGNAVSNSLPLTVGGPNITSISASTVLAGQQLTISGSNFGSTSGYIVFGTIYDPYNVSWTNTQIVVTVPAAAQSGLVSILTAANALSNALPLTVGGPNITSISPSTVTPGQQLTISGTGFGSASGYAVFGTIFDPYNVSWTNTQVIVTVPAAAQSGSFSIQTAGNALSNALPLTVGTPTITSISPSTISPGQQLTISGANFGSASGYAVFGTIFDPYNVSWTNTQIIATVPASAPSGSFYIQTGGGARSNAVTLTVSGAMASLSPASINMGSQAVGTAGTIQTITLSNPGTAVLSITSIIITGTNSGDFGQTNTCGASVAAGGNCTISVTFTPTASGARSATLTVTDNGPSSPQSVSLTGTGTAPNANLSPTSLTFTTEPVGTAAAVQTISLTNSGNAALSVSSIALVGANPGDFAQTNTCGASVAVGGNCTISVTFTPTASGARSATLTIADNAAGSPQAVSLAGSGTSNSPTVTLSPTSLAFGDESVEMNSESQTATLTNSGGTALSITSITFAGANPSDFSQANTCNSSVAAGGSCTIAILFTPTASGSRSAALNITDNAGASPQTLAVSGTGTHDVVLTWTPSGTAGIEGYNIYRGTASGMESTTPLNSSPVPAVPYVDENVQAGETYYYVVTTVSTNGNIQSSASTESSATVPSP